MMFALPKARVEDQMFIESFDVETFKAYASEFVVWGNLTVTNHEEESDKSADVHC